MRAVLVLLLASSGCVFELAEVAEQRRIPITTAPEIAADLVDVPVLVRLDPARFDYALTKPEGADLRFVDAGGAELAHDVEAWDPSGTSFVWVKLPVITSGAVTTFYLEWGGVERTVDGSQVWSAYTGAWHFDDTLEDGTVRDSGASGVEGTAEQMGPEDAVAGQIGGALFFDGTDGAGPRVTFNGDPRFEAPPDGARTIELWFRAEPGADGVLADKEGCCVGWSMGFGGASVGYSYGLACCVVNCCGSEEPSLYATAPAQPLPQGAADVDWHYAVMVIDRAGGELHGYLDGRSGGPGTLQPATTTGVESFRVGGNYDPMATNSFHGAIDEVRVAPAAVSADWVDVQHASMRDTLLVYGAPEGI
jgi:hypothetical protein